MKRPSFEPLARSMVLALLVLSAPFANAQEAAVKTFPSYKAAAAAFIAAVEAKDDAALKDILGTQEQDLLSSGDPVQDENERLAFLKSYGKAHTFVRESSDRMILTVGTTAWPLPFPIVRVGGAWHIDATEGAKELSYRRIGQNELDAIRVCRALHAAQKAYAAQSHDGVPAGAYAQRFRSEAGTENGLYWDVKEGEPQSPTGTLVAEATSEGYDSAKQSGKPTPFHGYFYRMLKSQGSHAPGGAKDYVKDGKMTGGFAFIAYPAEYGASGVMTFLVGPRGRVYQKDLGTDTEQAAKAMEAFDPDASWSTAR
jgi:Protein of unknown function (DUF2950)